MKQVTKQEWVEALRSGNYKQAPKMLYSNPARPQQGFCCLGVVCDLAGFQRNEQVGNFDIPANYSMSRYIPSALAEPLGLTNEVQGELAAMNDGIDDQGRIDKALVKTFPQIADWIEANL